MKKHSFLTLYIPTFNRCRILERNLAILLPFLQLFVKDSGIDVSVLVADNASTDDTESMISKYNYKLLSYHKNEKNIGSIRNFYNSILLCESDYIWVLGDDDFVLTSYFSDALTALYSFSPDLLFLGALGEENTSHNPTNFECSLEYLFLSYPLTSLAHISRLIYKKSCLVSLPDMTSITKDYYIWSWIAPAVYKSHSLRTACCPFPLVAATKDGGIDEWARRTPVPRLLELKDYIDTVASSQDSLFRMYELNYLYGGFPFRLSVIKALVLRPDLIHEIYRLAYVCMSLASPKPFYSLTMNIISLMPKSFWLLSSRLMHLGTGFTGILGK